MGQGERAVFKSPKFEIGIYAFDEQTACAGSSSSFFFDVVTEVFFLIYERNLFKISLHAFCRVKEKKEMFSLLCT